MGTFWFFVCRIYCLNGIVGWRNDVDVFVFVLVLFFWKGDVILYGGVNIGVEIAVGVELFGVVYRFFDGVGV